MDGKRIIWVDQIKGILIILVVIGHITANVERTYAINSFIYTFHMPLFFMISGCLSTNLADRSWAGYLLKKIKTLIIPYISFSVIGAYINGIETFPSYFMGSIKCGLWFLPCLFVFSVILISLCKISNGIASVKAIYIDLGLLLAATVILIIFFLITPNHLQNVFIPGTLLLYWPYYAMGYFISKYEIHLPSWLVGVAGLAFFAIWWGDNFYNISNKPIYQISRLCAVIFFYHSLRLEGKTQIMSVLGKESLCIYLMHSFFVTGLCNFALTKLDGNMFLMTIALFLMAIAISIICIGIKRIVGSNRLLGLLLFGK